MNIAFCVGNGSSRKKVDLSELKAIGPVYGCNNLIEEFALDNTIIVDRKPLIDLISRGFNKQTNVYTRKRWQPLIQADNMHFLSDPISKPVELWDREIHWGSGTHSLNLAAKNGSDVIVMIGYDLYDIDPACWIYQISKCFEMYPDTQFVQIQNKKWETPTSWTASNFQRDDFIGLTKLLKQLT